MFDGPVLRCEEGPVRALDQRHGGGGGGADVHGGGAVAVAAAALAAGAVGPAATLVAFRGPRVPVLALVVVAAPDVDVGGDAVGRGAADLLVAGL